MILYMELYLSGLVGCRLESVFSGYDLVVGFHRHGNTGLDSLRRGEFLDSTVLLTLENDSTKLCY